MIILKPLYLTNWEGLYTCIWIKLITPSLQMTNKSCSQIGHVSTYTLLNITANAVQHVKLAYAYYCWNLILIFLFNYRYYAFGWLCKLSSAFNKRQLLFLDRKAPVEKWHRKGYLMGFFPHVFRLLIFKMFTWESVDNRGSITVYLT